MLSLRFINCFMTAELLRSTRPEEERKFTWCEIGTTRARSGQENDDIIHLIKKRAEIGGD